MTSEPFVSVVTPVYNGEAYLKECIESILSQAYRNWEYIIVNNASTDGTGEIAAHYAALDDRIRVLKNDELLPIIANHNRAFRAISPTSKYCKVVSADDWIFPECLTKMVAFAEAHSNVGIVVSYQLCGGAETWFVRNEGLPYQSTVVSGREICRAHLLTDLAVFGNPTSTLYRSDLVRSSDAFYPNATAEADNSACFKWLSGADFGFVHQVLSFERLHADRITTVSQHFNAYLSSRMRDLREYGSAYLTEAEMEFCTRRYLEKYYQYLARSAIHFRDKEFWAFHSRRLKELGHPLDNARLSKAVLVKALDLALNPKRSAEALMARLR